jgi:hypothetical protein
MHGNTYCTTLVDQYSSYSELVLLKCRSAEQVLSAVELVLHVWHGCHGWSLQFHTDQGGEYINKLLREWCAARGITWRWATGPHLRRCASTCRPGGAIWGCTVWTQRTCDRTCTCACTCWHAAVGARASGAGSGGSRVSACVGPSGPRASGEPIAWDAAGGVLQLAARGILRAGGSVESPRASTSHARTSHCQHTPSCLLMLCSAHSCVVARLIGLCQAPLLLRTTHSLPRGWVRALQTLHSVLWCQMHLMHVCWRCCQRATSQCA